MLHYVTFLKYKEENANHHWQSIIHLLKDPVGIGFPKNEAKKKKNPYLYHQKNIKS